MRLPRQFAPGLGLSPMAQVDVGAIEREVRESGDGDECSDMTARFDATELSADSLARRCRGRRRGAARRSTPSLRESLELAAANMRAVAEAQIADGAAARSSCLRGRP